MFTTLFASTGLTSRTISSLYGLSAPNINRTQFSLLVTVMVLSAIVPTAIAQRWLSPNIEAGVIADAERGRAPAPGPGRRPLPVRERA